MTDFELQYIESDCKKYNNACTNLKHFLLQRGCVIQRLIKEYKELVEYRNENEKQRSLKNVKH